MYIYIFISSVYICYLFSFLPQVLNSNRENKTLEELEKELEDYKIEQEIEQEIEDEFEFLDIIEE